MFVEANVLADFTWRILWAVVNQETKRNEMAKRPETGSHTQNIDSDCTWLPYYSPTITLNFVTVNTTTTVLYLL